MYAKKIGTERSQKTLEKDIAGTGIDLVLRSRKVGFQWKNHQRRLEWDRVNGWHYNVGKSHLSAEDG